MGDNALNDYNRCQIWHRHWQRKFSVSHFIYSLHYIDVKLICQVLQIKLKINVAIDKNE